MKNMQKACQDQLDRMPCAKPISPTKQVPTPTKGHLPMHAAPAPAARRSPRRRRQRHGARLKALSVALPSGLLECLGGALVPRSPATSHTQSFQLSLRWMTECHVRSETRHFKPASKPLSAYLLETHDNAFTARVVRKTDFSFFSRYSSTRLEPD